uniref:Uncharacterized protein n=1 Tax=Solanum lycopersicum TaxID=4081 RepID=A0A3Q7EDG9_SOLLC
MANFRREKIGSIRFGALPTILYNLLPQQVVGNGVLVYLEKVGLQRDYKTLINLEPRSDLDPDIAPLTMACTRMTVLQVVPSMSKLGCFTMSILGTSILHFLFGDVVFKLNSAGLIGVNSMSLVMMSGNSFINIRLGKSKSSQHLSSIVWQIYSVPNLLIFDMERAEAQGRDLPCPHFSDLPIFALN